jgi:hypothetical protein
MASWVVFLLFLVATMVLRWHGLGWATTIGVLTIATALSAAAVVVLTLLGVLLG